MRLSRLLAIVGLIAALAAVAVVDATAGKKKKKVETTVTAQFESPGYFGDEGYIVGSVHTDPNVPACLKRGIAVNSGFYAGDEGGYSGPDGSFRLGPLRVIPDEDYDVFVDPKKLRKKTCESVGTALYTPPYTP